MKCFSWIILLSLGSALLNERTVQATSDYSSEEEPGVTGGGEGGADDDVPLTPEDFETAENLSPDDLDKWFEPAEGDDYEDDVGPEEDILTSATDRFEGDIVFPPDTNIWSFVDNVEAGGTEGEADDYDLPNVPLASAIRGRYNKWKNNEIPYVITRDFDAKQRGVIASAIAEYDSNTCIRWVRRTNQKDYVQFRAGAGCYSYVGRTGGRQVVSLGSGCVHKGIVVHEMMHAAGFFHEQSRADRDNYVSIKWGRIFDGVKGNFNKYSLSEIDHLDTTYDCDSIMHYGPTAFSKSGQQTIVAKDPKCNKIGQRKGLSAIDKLDLNRLYNCSATGILKKITGSCYDRNSYCKAWARDGYCRTYKPYMHKSCAKSCDKCDDINASCKDENRHCTTWANRGECSNNPGYMLYKCKKACNQCSAENSIQCKDTVTSCATFKESGYCSDGVFKPFMKKFCQKTCDLC